MQERLLARVALGVYLVTGPVVLAWLAREAWPRHGGEPLRTFVSLVLATQASATVAMIYFAGSLRFPPWVGRAWMAATSTWGATIALAALLAAAGSLPAPHAAWTVVAAGTATAIANAAIATMQPRLKDG